MHGGGDEETAREEQDVGVAIADGDGFHGEHAGKGEEYEGHQGGGGGGHAFGDPPDGHERGHGLNVGLAPRVSGPQSGSGGLRGL